MSNSAQQKAAALFDKTRTASAITTAKRGIAVILIICAVLGIVLYIDNREASSTAYGLANSWIVDEDYRELVPLIRNAMNNGILEQHEWRKIWNRQEEIETIRQREELLKTVITGLP